jgi:glycosyltransferase involved in cell wall biosynthesis
VDTPPLRSLFIFPFESNPGYAITYSEILFYETGLELAARNPSFVHFAYINFKRGHPKFLPNSFTNLVEFDFENRNRTNIERLQTYVRDNKIQFVLIMDIQPVHPVFKALRKAGATAIMTYWAAQISSRTPVWKLILKRLEVALSASKVDGLIFQSKAMAGFAIFGRGVPKNIIDIVPPGIDTTVFRPDHSDYAYQELGLPRERKIAAYSGHMERRKGVHILVEAAIDLLTRRHREDVCFLICGNRDDGEIREYQSMYAGMGIDHLIRFGGYRSDLSKIYPSCFCGVIPTSGWDSFTRASLEMAASGLPVIASRIGGLPEAVVDCETGLLFDPGRAEQLADCIELLLNKPELAQALGRHGRERCEREFNLDVHRQRFFTVVQRRLEPVFKHSLVQG